MWSVGAGEEARISAFDGSQLESFPAPFSSLPPWALGESCRLPVACAHAVSSLMKDLIRRRVDMGGERDLLCPLTPSLPQIYTPDNGLSANCSRFLIGLDLCDMNTGIAGDQQCWCL